MTLARCGARLMHSASGMACFSRKLVWLTQPLRSVEAMRSLGPSVRTDRSWTVDYVSRPYPLILTPSPPNRANRLARWALRYVRAGAIWLALAAAAAVVFAGYMALIWFAPRLVVGSRLNGIADPAQRATAEYNARVLIVSIAGALVVVITLSFTGRTYALNRRGQATERFTRALEQTRSESRPFDAAADALPVRAAQQIVAVAQ